MTQQRQLTDEQIKHFRQHGYVAVPDFFPPVTPCGG